MSVFISMVVIISIVAIIFQIRQQDIFNLAAAERDLDAKDSSLYVYQSSLKHVEREWALAFGSFCAIDIETTGLSKSKCRIIQVAIVSFQNGRMTNTWSTYLNPGLAIPENATKVNNITNAMVSSAPTFVDLMPDLRYRLSSNPLVAHNLKFDTEFLTHEFTRQGVALYPTYGHCTMRMASGAPTSDPPREERTFYSKRNRKHVTYKVQNRAPWQKLHDAMTSHGIRPKGRMHDALTDAIACGEVFVARGLAAITEANNAVITAKLNKVLSENRLTKAHKLRQRWPQ